MRQLTVSSLAAPGCREVPFIRLRGKWLQALGFGIGMKFTVEASEGRLVLKVYQGGLMMKTKVLQVTWGGSAKKIPLIRLVGIGWTKSGLPTVN